MSKKIPPKPDDQTALDACEKLRVVADKKMKAAQLELAKALVFYAKKPIHYNELLVFSAVESLNRSIEVLGYFETVIALSDSTVLINTDSQVPS